MKRSIYIILILIINLLFVPSGVFALDEQENFIYLSDIPYVEEKSFAEGSHKIRLDMNDSTNLIYLNIDGVDKPFIKGVSTWATSEIVYDLSEYNYDYFTTYLGVDASEKSTYYNTGVKFYIYKSEDGENWGEAVEVTDTLRGDTPAKFVKIDIKNTKFLKLVVDDNSDNWWSTWYDEAVYADAKLIKESYVQDNSTVDFVKTVAEYDKIIKKYYSSNKEISGEYELTLLKREFVSNVGYDVLQAFVRINDDYKNIVNWLMSDVENLRLYIVGGTPDGSYVNSLKVLSNLYNAYKNDLSNNSVTAYGTPLKKIYKKMMITLSLTHSTDVGLWVTGTSGNPDGINDSNAIDRYAIFKELHAKELLDNKLFEQLEIEEMRFVMNNIIDDESIVWLNDLAREKNDRNPYSYLEYKFGYDYWKSDYYNLDNYDKWNDKYNLGKYNISYKQNYPKLWVVFEEGGVCGAISKTGSNLHGVNGVPSSVVGQPGHAAYIFYSLNSSGEGVWNLYNDVSGWAKSSRTEKLGIRMPNGWGIGSYVSEYPVTYILLAQANLNDFDNYQKSEEILLLANTYSNDTNELYKIYREALTIEKLNFDAWLGLVNLYVSDTSKTEKDYIALSEEIIDTLKYYPLPMYDLLRIIEPKITSNEGVLKFTLMRQNALTDGTNATPEQTIQQTAVRQVANYLLGNTDSEIASFSFDGDDAGFIKLSEDKFGNTGVTWEYSLDGKETWKQTSEHNHKLTEEELNMISSEHDINIHIVGTDYSDTNIFTIDITKSTLPTNLYGNDYENKVIGVTDTMQWRLNDNDEWTYFNTSLPNLTVDKAVSVRIANTGTTLASDSMNFYFTKDKDSDTFKYITIDRLSIEAVSTEEAGRGETGDKVIDGNANTIWHTLWNGTDTEKYIVIKIQEKTYISGIEYYSRQDTGTNGMVLSAKILVSEDGTTWKEVVSSTEWTRDKSPKVVTFDEPVLGQYVKIIGVTTSGNYMSASMINLYEDITKQELPSEPEEPSEPDEPKEPEDDNDNLEADDNNQTDKNDTNDSNSNNGSDDNLNTNEENSSIENNQSTDEKIGNNEIIDTEDDDLEQNIADEEEPEKTYEEEKSELNDNKKENSDDKKYIYIGLFLILGIGIFVGIKMIKK